MLKRDRRRKRWRRWKRSNRMSRINQLGHYSTVEITRIAVILRTPEQPVRARHITGPSAKPPRKGKGECFCVVSVPVALSFILRWALLNLFSSSSLLLFFSSSPRQPLSLPISYPFFYPIPLNHSPSSCSRGMSCLSSFFFLSFSIALCPSLLPSLTNLVFSGLARTLGRAAFARPAAPVARAAFQPLRTNGLPSLTRFASSEAAASASQIGKIHQVIGAVVDGMLFFFPLRACCYFLVPARSRARPRPRTPILTTGGGSMGKGMVAKIFSRSRCPLDALEFISLSGYSTF